MKIDVITIFPHFFDIFLNTSIIKRAIEKKKVHIQMHDLRKYSQRKHQQIDDTPYGGDHGMILAFPPFYECLKKIKTDKSQVVLLSPQGKVLNQKKANYYVQNYYHLILLCGHYEGIDARIIEHIDEEISIGDYVLTGGEIAATVIIDTLTRLLPGVIKKESYLEDSHQNIILKYPQYTKPKEYKGYKVPDVLISGNHEKIKQWRQEQSLKITWLKRPDLLSKISLNEKQEKLLNKIKKEKK
ncbi:tRNA (guanine(37)-N(1))-methyltransferase [Candidatus Phytoplasma luffae]|uniref:tRNA (guanine-N(1)-)-methyltransferase n=1 Tax=Loofah witches'-broom phytoplasma TaxID=35773 RepID=A0A975FLG9_LOWBP|nr:tRNA (guanosine(37)-N1)-methyltransferase TrmD [Candidatus Phytoplasma luffae]QTX03166.1 tRNA (guanine(37)-N(1))-methyltransferase [Candidatus Phytoplasma luffae]